MKNKQTHTSNELFEKGYSTLKEDPWRLLFLYYCGSIPFCIYFLFFWFEFSFNPFAEKNTFLYSLIGVLLFGWMKYFQSLYCTEIYNRLKLNTEFRIRHSIKEMLFQYGIQSIGAACFLLSSIIVFPMGACYFYFNNLLIQPTDDSTDYTQRLKTNPIDNKLKGFSQLLFLLYAKGLYLIVFVNMITLIYFSPYLLKMFLGLETVFLKKPGAMMNSTTMITAAVLSYLIFDPFIKSTVTYIHFIKSSRPNGEDLLVRLQKIVAPALLLISFLVISVQPLQADETGKPSKKALDHSFQKTISQKKYVWRQPKSAKASDGTKTLSQRISEMFERFFKKKENENSGQEFKPRTTAIEFGEILNLGLYIVLGVALLLVILLIVKNIRLNQERENQQTLNPTEVKMAKSIEEEVLEYEEEEWVRLINDLITDKDYRAAIRHIYLHTLQCLAEQNYLLIKKHKTNKQYKKEMSRRTKHLPDLKDRFSQIITRFEVVWFGLHDIAEEDLLSTVESLKSLKKDLRQDV